MKNSYENPIVAEWKIREKHADRFVEIHGIMKERDKLWHEEHFGEEVLLRRQPYPIRSHHLGDFYRLVTKLYQDSFTLDQRTDFSPHALRDVARIERYKRASIRSHDKEMLPGYARDVFGTTSTEERIVFHRMVESKLRFCALPDDYPVIIHPYNDHVCNACIFGNHCKKNPTLAEIQDENSFPSKFIEFLHEHPNRAQLLRETDIDYDYIEPADMPNKIARLMKVSTNAGIVRKTFEYIRRENKYFSK